MNRLIKSFGFALRGIRFSIWKEQNFKLQLLLFIVVSVAGYSFELSTMEWIIVLVCSGLVMGMEMMNSAVEKLCDVVSKEQHPGIRNAKDIAAGAVLLTACFSAVCGGLIFIPKIILWIQSM